MSQEPVRRFGTLTGVFTPTLLTILGVILFLRLGWTVGNAGLAGAWLIISLAIGITLLTGLSLSSIATNTRLGHGGPYAIIAKSLGLEVGGAIGVPLYLSQALAVAMYVIGFREGWLWIFPEHPSLLVDLGVFSATFAIAWISADFAFRVQYVVMAVIAVAIASVLGGIFTAEAHYSPDWWGEYPGERRSDGSFSGGDFWTVFAVFFPAATGIMAGANMSGELRDPRRSIPRGTLSAIAVSSVVYLGLAAWCAQAAPTEELVSNYNVMIERSAWAPAVIAGILGATFSSGLASIVGAPRILMALARDGAAPSGKWLSVVADNGEPRRALAITGVVILLALAVRDLNLIAPLITMFFLIAYLTINLVVLVEQSLGLTSFRPSLRLPLWIPLLGVVGCALAMFIVNAVFGLSAVATVVAIYLGLLWRGVPARAGDVRSGIFSAFAEWAAAKVVEHELDNPRAWKPSLLVPVETPAALRGEFHLLVDICRPEGQVKLLGLATEESVERVTTSVRRVSKELIGQDVFTTWSVVDSAGFTTGTIAGLQALGGAFFKPNVVFLRLPSDPTRYEDHTVIINETRRQEKVGLMLLAMHPEAGLGRRKVINLWVRPPTSEALPTEARIRGSGVNLGILMAYRLTRAWSGQLNIISVVDGEDQVEGTRRYLEELRDLTRLPSSAVIDVPVGEFEDCLGRAQQSDMDILALRGDDLDFVKRVVKATRSSCMFTRDSGQESAVA